MAVTLAQSVKDAQKRRKKFRAARERGLNYEEIAAKFGVTRQRAYQIVNHDDSKPVGRPGRKPSEDKQKRDNDMRALFAEGVSQGDLAARFGLSRKTVSAIVGRKNGRRGPLPGTPRPPRTVAVSPDEVRAEMGLQGRESIDAAVLTDWP